MANLSHIDTWVFDLDNTLYPRSCDLFKQVDVQISSYVAKVYGLDDLVEAKKIQKDLFRRFGTTLKGLTEDKDVDPHDFMQHAHNIDYSPVPKMPKLNEMLGQLKGRKLIFTNGDMPHVERCLERMGISEHFDDAFDVEAANWVPKPQLEAYEIFSAKYNIDHATTAMFEDMAVNLEVPKQLGWATVHVQSDGTSLGEAWEHEGGDADHIDHRTTDLTAFLKASVS